MSKMSLIVLELIKEGYSLNEIQKKLNLEPREFSNILKNIRDYGYNFTRTLFSDGKILLKPNKTIEFPQRINKTRLVVNDRILKAIFISDLHIGSSFERPELLKKVYEYAKSHDIHIIFNAGDVIDNVYTDSNQILKNPTVESQIRKLIKVYPFDPDIINLNLYGNHDFKSLKEDGLDIARLIEQKRYDLISLNYGFNEILLKDDSIAIIHDLKKSTKNKPNPNVSITFKGHSHKSKNSYKEDKKIFIPTLSDVTYGAYEYRPLVCFLEAEFIFIDKMIERINLRQLAIVKNEIRLANEEAIVLRKEPIEKRKAIKG